MWTVTLTNGEWLKVDNWKVEGGSLIVYLMNGGRLERHAAYSAHEWRKVEFTIP